MNPSSSGGLVDGNRPSDPVAFNFEHEGSTQLNISKDILISNRGVAISDRPHQFLSREDGDDALAADMLSAAVSNRMSQLSAVEEEDDAKLNQDFQNYLSNQSLAQETGNAPTQGEAMAMKNFKLSTNVHQLNDAFPRDNLAIKHPQTTKSSKSQSKSFNMRLRSPMDLASSQNDARSQSIQFQLNGSFSNQPENLPLQEILESQMKINCELQHLERGFFSNGYVTASGHLNSEQAGAPRPSFQHPIWTQLLR